MLTRGCRRDSISLTGPSINPEVSAAPQHTPFDPTLSIEYRFTIIYKDGKAARLVPGAISDKEVCSIFKADLRAFEIGQPKDQVIFLDEQGSISFTFMRYDDDSDNNVRLHLCLLKPCILFVNMICGSYTSLA